VTVTDVDGLLEQARIGLDRLSPRAAYAAWLAGAELVDIRPAAQRAAEGEVPGALLLSLYTHLTLPTKA
jgi:hypothetical protein